MSEVQKTPEELDLENTAKLEEAKAALEAKFKEEYEDKIAKVVGNKDDILAEKKKLQETMKQYEDVDIEALLKMKTNLEADEEGRLIAEGKGEEVWNKRTERLQKDMNAKIDALTLELETERSTNTSLQDERKRLNLDHRVRDEATKAGVLPKAVDYVLRLARDTFEEDEAGNLVPRDSYGDIILGKDAKNPQPIKEWVVELQDKVGFVFPPSTGSGATGSGRAGSQGAFTAEYVENLSPEEYVKLRKEGKI